VVAQLMLSVRYRVVTVTQARDPRLLVG